MYQEQQLQETSTAWGRQRGQVDIIKLALVTSQNSETACLDLCIVCFHMKLLLFEDFYWLKLMLDAVKVSSLFKGT